jgi:hypothetical protein
MPNNSILVRRLKRLPADAKRFTTVTESRNNFSRISVFSCSQLTHASTGGQWGPRAITELSVLQLLSHQRALRIELIVQSSGW